MDPEEIKGFILVGSLLISMGFDGAKKIKEIVTMFRSDATDAELDAIVTGTVDDARRRKELADQESGGSPA